VPHGPTLASGLEPREIVAGVMRRSSERARGDHEKALGVGDRLVGLEFLWCDELLDLVVLARRLQVLADGDEIDVGSAQVVHQLQHFVTLFAETDHDAGFGEHRWIEFLDALKQADGVEVSGAWTDGEIVARYGFHVVVEHIGFGGDDALQCPRLLQEIGRQDFDGGLRRSGADRPDHLLEMFGATVGQVVTVDGGNDDVGEAHLLDGLGDVLGFRHVERIRLAGGDVAEGACAGTDLAHDHEGGVFLVPAFADVRATGFFADRHELVRAHQFARLLVALGHRRLDTDPLRLAQHFGIGLMSLFRMADALGIGDEICAV